jgi:hypothetical protein
MLITQKLHGMSASFVSLCVKTSSLLLSAGITNRHTSIKHRKHKKKKKENKKHGQELWFLISQFADTTS